MTNPKLVTIAELKLGCVLDHVIGIVSVLQEGLDYIEAMRNAHIQTHAHTHTPKAPTQTQRTYRHNRHRHTNTHMTQIREQCVHGPYPANITCRYKQLVNALGKEVTAADFADYQRFHNRKLFKQQYQMRSFAYAIRRPGASSEWLCICAFVDCLI